MRVVARYSAIFLPSRSISNSDTRAHFIPRTVLAASATAFSAAFAKLSLEAPTMSMTFCAMFASLGGKYTGRRLPPRHLLRHMKEELPVGLLHGCDQFPKRPPEADFFSNHSGLFRCLSLQKVRYF